MPFSQLSTSRLVTVFACFSFAYSTFLPTEISSDNGILRTIYSDTDGGVFEYTPYQPIFDGTCQIRFPENVKFFDTKNAHIRVDAPKVESNLFRIVSANSVTEPSSGPFQFTIYFKNGLSFQPKEIEVFCDSSDIWQFSVYSFPQSLDNSEIQTNIYPASFSGGLVSYTVDFPSQVNNFDLNKPSGQFSTDNNRTFNIFDVPGNEPVWMKFEYISSFLSNEVIVGNQDQIETTTTNSNPDSPTGYNPTTMPDSVSPDSTPKIYPTCMHEPNDNFRWSTCPKETNKNEWYGVSFRSENLQAAVQACADMGPLKPDGTSASKLAWIDSQDTDKCMYDLMHWMNLEGDETLLIGAYYEENFINEALSGYKWIDYEGENGNGTQLLSYSNSLNYKNFLDGTGDSDRPSSNAVAAYLGPNAKYFAEYGWIEVNEYDSFRYVCRIDCDEVDSGWSIGFSLILVIGLQMLTV